MVFKEARFRGEKRALVLPVAADLEAKVAKALAGAPDLDGSSITVTAVADAIVLAGFVTSEAERQRAGEQAALVEGVSRIENRLQLR